MFLIGGNLGGGGLGGIGNCFDLELVIGLKNKNKNKNKNKQRACQNIHLFFRKQK